MTTTPSLVFDGVWKRFRRGQMHDSLRDLIPAVVRRLSGRGPRAAAASRDFWALRDLSFTVKPGDVLGIIGPNGAGKSTALKILNRIMEPTAGSVQTIGRIGALIEVSAGFHQDLTGRQNVYLQGAIMGMRKAEVRRKFDEIVAFSGIEDFIDTPVKRYSSGMNARLGFSIAAHLEPDILIIDEVLAVGDTAFQAKAFGRVKTMAQAGAPAVLVSHQLDRIAELCTKVIVLERGTVRTSGTAMHCINEYLHGRSAGTAEHGLHTGIHFEHLVAPNGLAVFSGEDLSIIVNGTAAMDSPPSTWVPCVRIVDSKTAASVHAVTGLQRGVPLPLHGEFEYHVTLQMNLQPGTYDIRAVIWDSAIRQDVIVGPKLQVEVLEKMPFYDGVQLNSRWVASKTGVSAEQPVAKGGQRRQSA